MTTNVLLIGSGRRICNSFIPALQCLQETHSIVGLYSPTLANRQSVCNKWGIAEVSDLSPASFDNVDMIIISISTRAIPAVLKSIGKSCKGKLLLVDTPVFINVRSFLDIRALKPFGHVSVAEDFICFPHFRIMRDIINRQVLGKIKKIELYRTGYEYHGLALIRSFLNLEKVYSTSKKPAADGGQKIIFDFKSGAQGSLIEPYSRFDGWVYVEGDKRSLIYDPNNLYDGASSENVIRLQHRKTDDGMMVFSIDGKDVSAELQPTLFCKLQKLDIGDTSDFNTFKTCGLVSIIHPDSVESNIEYTLKAGLYDSLASILFWKDRNYPSFINRLILSLLNRAI